MKGRISLAAILAMVMYTQIGCVHAPSTASPQAQVAFQSTRAIKALDLLRDYAIDANGQNPPLISVETTRKIVTYHRSAITTIHDFPNGWKSSVSTGLDEVQKNLSASEATKLAPYFALVKTVIAEVL